MLPVIASPFPYDTLHPNTANALRQQAAKIRGGVKATTAAIIEVGRDLIAVKQELEHGQFEKWVQAECGFGLRSAQNYMRAAEWAEGKSATVAYLTPASIYKLAAKSTPSDVVAAVVDRAKTGTPIADRDVDCALKEARQTTERNRRLPARALSKRRRKQREQEERRRLEITQQRAAAATTNAKSLLDRFGSEGVRFLFRVIDDQEADFWDVCELLGKQLNGAASVARAEACHA